METFYPLASEKQRDGIFQQVGKNTLKHTKELLFTVWHKNIISILLMSNTRHYLYRARHHSKQSLDLCNSLITIILFGIHTVNMRHLPGFRQPQHQAATA